jgi:guanyl-specific ribonuclease Sa
MKKALVAILALPVAILLFAMWPEAPAPVTAVATPSAPPRPPPKPASARSGARSVARPAPQPGSALGDPALDRQVAAIIDAMDRTGRPPASVAQGGRRGGRRGLFENAEARLPVRPRGYYTETDVWPRRAGGRGGQRLIFGQAGEVYYTPDHYRTFVQLR